MDAQADNATTIMFFWGERLHKGNNSNWKHATQR